MRFLILFSLLLGLEMGAFAAEQDFISWIRWGMTEQVPLEKNMPYQGIFQDEAMLERILSVPETLRPYLYPMLFENFSPFSKKILTHPEIEPFKGKIPELSGDLLQNRPKKILEFLPSIYYPLFAPESVREQVFMFLNKDEG